MTEQGDYNKAGDSVFGRHLLAGLWVGIGALVGGLTLFDVDMLKVLLIVGMSWLAPLVGLAAEPVALGDDPGCTEVDRGFMERAYELAREAVKEGNGPFGALLVVDGKVVAEAKNAVGTAHDPTRHAELALISTFSPKIDREAFRRGVLYASSEPCTMCSGAILNAGLTKVVYGTTESQFQLFISDVPKKDPLTSREVMARGNPEVVVLGPLMEKEGLEIHAAYWPEAMKAWSKGK